MKAASVSEIKKELNQKSAGELMEICLRLARAKKENKELLTYLLFEANDVDEYIEAVKREMDEGFLDINMYNMYFAKKSLRKILRNTNKYIRYTGLKTTEAELLIYFCTKLKELNIKQKSPALNNLYNMQVKKIKAVVESFHEDLQYDYKSAISNLTE